MTQRIVLRHHTVGRFREPSAVMSQGTLSVLTFDDSGNIAAEEVVGLIRAGRAAMNALQDLFGEIYAHPDFKGRVMDLHEGDTR